MQKTEQALNDLAGWSGALNQVVQNITPQIMDVIRGKSKLLPNCPSRAAGAELILRDAYKKFLEVEDALERVKVAIYEEGK